jgi:hypothetical protein
MNAKYGKLYAASVIKAGIYPSQDKDNKNTVVWNILVANANMPDEMAYKVVQTMIEKKADLVAVHQEAKSFSLENQIKSNSSVPWHPGAVKYFTEQGVKM